MPSYKGHCHCGEVSFEFTTEQPIDGGTRCTCSICVRNGAMMSNEFIDEANLLSSISTPRPAPPGVPLKVWISLLQSLNFVVRAARF
jgi:hypothetical protein